MKRLRIPALLASVSFFSSLARAHPGHDGGHDLTWDYADVAKHVLTSPYHLMVLAAVGTLAVLLARGLAKWANGAKTPRKGVSEAA